MTVLRTFSLHVCDMVNRSMAVICSVLSCHMDCEADTDGMKLSRTESTGWE